MAYSLGVCLALAAGLANAQATVEGQVLDAVTNAPVRKAMVSLYCGSWSYTESDAEGRFASRTARVGVCRIGASANGYLSADSDFNLADGQKLSGIVLRLVRTSAISGRIVDEDGDPMNGFQVQLFYATYGPGGKQFFPESDGKSATDDRGRYRIPGLSAGKYYLSVSRPGNLDFHLVENQTSLYLPTFYPGIVDPAGAVAIEIPSGSELENLNLKLRRAPVVRVRGRVTQVANTTAYLIPDSIVANPQGIQGQNGGTGDFEFRGVPPGDYTLSIRAFASDTSKPAPGGGPPALTGLLRRRLTVGDSDIEGLTISIPPPASITARVVIDGEAARDLSKVSLTVGRVPAIGYNPLSGGKPAGDGTFRFVDLAADRYRIWTDPRQSGLYLKSVRMGGRELPEPEFDLNGSAEVEVVLSSHTASLAGVVHRPDSDQPAAGVTVVLIPQAKGLDDYLRATTDESGRFALRNIVPGEYRVFAWEKLNGRTLEYYDPEFVHPVESKGVAVSLSEGASKNIELTAIPPVK